MTTNSSPPQEVEVTKLPLDMISVRENFNPRRYFDDSAMDSLIKDVQQKGVIQSLLVRPRTDGEQGYFLVAGERRLRAARQAEIAMVPAVIRDMSDQEALAYATAENESREDLSVAEEARLARRGVEACQGDRGEAARVLGWSRSRIDARLLLLHATDNVLDALERGEIVLGVAELFATMPDVSQDRNLPTIIEKGITVAQFKDKLANDSQQLTYARFNTELCRGCQYNSTTQNDFFSTSVGKEKCSNYECWNEKTQAHLAAVIEDKKSDFATVLLDSDVAVDTIKPLVCDEVGAEQFSACQQCASYGVVVSSAPGREGGLSTPQCFNLSCHTKKVAALTKAKKAEKAKAEDVAGGMSPGDAIPSTDTGNGSVQGSTPVAPDQPADKPKPKDAVPEIVPNAVKELSEQAVRERAMRCLDEDDKGRLDFVLSVLAQMNLAQSLDRAAFDKALEVFDAGTPSGTEMASQMLPHLYAASSDTLKSLRRAMSRIMLSQPSCNYSFNCQRLSTAVCQTTNADLADTFVITPEFLKAHRKKGMACVLQDAEFSEWLDARDGEGSFDKLMKQTIPEIIETVFPKDGKGFDFVRRVPKVVSAALKV
jgi:ParB family chromosome partitioning protein